MDDSKWGAEHITIGQLAAFVSAVKAGSFSAAARRHQRAQSSISLAINNLETDLGVRLFDRSTHTPRLTDAGHLLFEDALAVVHQIRRMQERAQVIATLRKVPSCIVTDQLCPPDLISLAVSEFESAFPNISARLEIRNSPDEIRQLLKDTECLAITALACRNEDRGELLPKGRVGMVELVPVASPNHKLVDSMPLDSEELHRFRRVEFPYTMPSLSNWAAQDAMRVNDLGTCIKLIEAGFGWSLLPLHRIASKLDSGQLVKVEVNNADVSVMLGVELIGHCSRKNSVNLRTLSDRILSACRRAAGIGELQRQKPPAATSVFSNETSSVPRQDQIVNGAHGR